MVTPKWQPCESPFIVQIPVALCVTELVVLLANVTDAV